MSNNFLELPTCLNDIINGYVKDLEQHDSIRVSHKNKMNNCFNAIKGINKVYKNSGRNITLTFTEIIKLEYYNVTFYTRRKFLI